VKRVLFLTVCGALLGGCSTFSTCPSPPEELMEAAEVPPISVPLGLETPDTADALKIPELTEPERPRKEEEGCLDAPPSYFPDRRPGAERENPPGQG
jgi:hypothetical protein